MRIVNPQTCRNVTSHDFTAKDQSRSNFSAFRQLGKALQEVVAILAIPKGFVVFFWDLVGKQQEISRANTMALMRK